MCLSTPSRRHNISDSHSLLDRLGRLVGCAMCGAVALGGLLVSAVTAHAQIEPPTLRDHCLTYNGRYMRAPVMRVRAEAGERLFFFDMAQACTDGDACPWRRSDYLVDGEFVLVSTERNGFRCAYYGTHAGELIAGFLPADHLIPAEDGMLNNAFLVGRWNGGSKWIEFTRTPGELLHAEGEVIWTGQYTTHDGGFWGTAIILGGGVHIIGGDEVPGVLDPDDDPESYDCRVHGWRAGPYLIVHDNLACGGLNANFKGIYVKPR